MSGETFNYRAPVGEGFVENLKICRGYYWPIIKEAYTKGDMGLLRRIGVCRDIKSEHTLFYLAVDPKTGESAAKCASYTNTHPFTAFTDALKGFDPEITPAQASTVLVALPFFNQIANRFPSEFSDLEVLFFSVPELNLGQKIWRNF